MAPVDLSALVRQVSEVYASRAEQAGLTFVLRLPEGPVWARGNAAQLQHGLDNLVDNAFKYTPEGGAVTVGLTNAPGETESWVEDTGIGIPADGLPQLFSRFHRGPQRPGLSGQRAGPGNRQGHRREPRRARAGGQRRPRCALHAHVAQPADGLITQADAPLERHAQYSQLSIGQQRRLALLAVAHRPPVVILDEPTAGLDVGSRTELHTMMTELGATPSHVHSALERGGIPIRSMSQAALVGRGLKNRAEIQKRAAAMYLAVRLHQNRRRRAKHATPQDL